MTLLSVGKVGISGYRDRIFMYRKKSGKSMRAAMRLPKINIASTTIPNIAMVCTVDPPPDTKISSVEFIALSANPRS